MISSQDFSDSGHRARREEYHRAFLALLPRGVRHSPPHPPIFTGYEYATLYDWDQYFDAILLGYCGFPVDYTRNGLLLFLNLQDETGFIPRSFHPERGVHVKHRVMFKPFLAQTALMIFHREGVAGWLEGDVFDRLLRFYDCWRTRFDPRGAGLSVWHDAAHTGMDNHEERAGTWGADTDFCEGADLNSYLVREGTALFQIARLIGRDDVAARLEEDVEIHKQAILRWLWDERRGMFFDYHARENRFIEVRHVGAFAPLWAGVPTTGQADRLIREHLLNPEEFWRPYPIPALAATEPGYSEGFLPGESTGCCNWRANTWIPSNYFVFQGLRAYGYGEVARELAARTFALFGRARFSEYYTSESGAGTGLKPFWGWSALAIYMPEEWMGNVDPTALGATNHAVATVRKQLTGGFAATR